MRTRLSRSRWTAIATGAALLSVAACSTSRVDSVDAVLAESRAPWRTSPTSSTPAAPERDVARAEHVGPWTLDQALRRIAAASPNIARARTRIEEARAALREARAGYVPELSFNLSYVATDEPMQAFGILLNQQNLSLGPGFDATPGTTQNWREEVRLDWALFAPGRAQQRDAAREGEQAAEFYTRAVEQRLLNAGVQAWLGLRAARQLERVALDSVAVVEQRVEQTRKRADEGAALQADVLRLEVRAAAARDEAARAHLDAERARNGLAALMGTNPDELNELSDEAIAVGVELPADLGALLDAAAEQRADLAALAHQARLQGISRQATEAGRMPMLGLFASYAIDGEDPTLDTDLDKYMVGVGLRIPLSARTAPRIDGARARERGAREDVRVLALDIEREVRDAWSELAAAEQTFELARTAVTAATEAYRVTALAQDSGAATVTDVLEAQDALNRARVRETAAAAGIQIARAKLVAATGGVR